MCVPGAAGRCSDAAQTEVFANIARFIDQYHGELVIAPPVAIDLGRKFMDDFSALELHCSVHESMFCHPDTLMTPAALTPGHNSMLPRAVQRRTQLPAPPYVIT